MRKFLVVVVLLAVAVTGCAKKSSEPPVPPEIKAARKMLIEGTVFLKQGEVVKAVEAYATAIKTAPNYFEAYYMLGETFLNLKQYPQAAAIMGSAVRQFPDNGLAYYLLSVADQGAGQTLPAIVAARRSLELFVAVKDEQGTKRSALLLGVLVQTAKQQVADEAAVSAASEAQKALEKIDIPVAENK